MEVEVYSRPNIETVTATTYRRQLTCYLLPVFEGMAEDIAAAAVAIGTVYTA